MKRLSIALLTTIAALAAGGAPALARAPSGEPAAANAAPQVPGWDAFIEALRTLPGEMLAKLPPEMRADPQIRAEVGRLALESLASSSLNLVGADGDFPVFLPTIGQVLDIGQPNADTIYRFAQITPGGSYRLRGSKGSLTIATIGQNRPSPYEKASKDGKVGAVPVYHDINALHADADGRFDVLLSPARPAGYTGDWWELLPATNKLFLRMVSTDWANERDPTITVERVDRPMRRPRTAAGELAQRLEQLPAQVRFSALLFVDHVAQLRSQGYVNTLKVLDVSQMGGLKGQFYYEGAYDLADDEALVIAAKVPAKCQYRSIILTNELYETTDWTDNHASLNAAQAAPDKDGVLRVVVANRDPGVPNWLDTAGYSKGLVQGRWTNCDSQPIPTVRKVALRDLRKVLPPETGMVSPAERDRITRERRRAYQERPQW